MKKKLIILLTVIAGLFLFNTAGVLAYDVGVLSVHGFVSQGYLKSTDNNYLAKTEEGTFEFNETAINFSAEPVDNLRVGLQLMSRDMGSSKNNDIFLDWGYADYLFNDVFGIRVGKVKLPMGFYNQTRDIDFLRTPILLPQGVYDETQRELLNAYQGGSVYGNFDVAALGNVEYELLLGTFNADTNAPFLVQFYRGIGGGGTGTGLYADMEYGFAQAVRWITPIEGLRFGITNLMSDMNYGGTFNHPLFGPDTVVTTKMTINRMPVFSVEYVNENLTLAAEYKQFDIDYDLIYNSVITIPMGTTYESYYALVSYRFCDWFELGTYYSEHYPNKDDKDGDNQPAGFDYFAWQKDWTVSAKFNFLGNMVLKFENHFINGAAQLWPHENPQGREEDWNLFVAKCSINF